MAKGTASTADTIQMTKMIAVDCQGFMWLWKGLTTPNIRSQLIVANEVTLTNITSTESWMQQEYASLIYSF